MDEMTQQNASLVEETSAASQSLKDEGKELLHLMNFFVTDSNVATFDSKPAQKANQDTNIRDIRAPKVANSSFKLEEDGDEWEEF